MTLRDSRFIVIGACAWLFVIAGCSILSPQPDRTKFFVLTSTTGAGATGTAPAAANGTSDLVIGVGPIGFPDYLRRPEVITRTSPTTVELSDVDRWAEPLDSAFARVLSEDLSRRLGTQRMVTYPWYKSSRVDYQVECNVIHFETDSTGGSHLHAQWSIRDGTGKLLIARESDLTGTEAPDDKSPSASLSHDLGNLSQQIATQLKELSQQNNRRNTALDVK
jgi:uncharacterized lipoprotein YmbA